jgi:hypothetical protein
MFIVLASYTVDHGFVPWLSQTKDYKIGIMLKERRIIIIRNGAKTISLPNFVWET